MAQIILTITTTTTTSRISPKLSKGDKVIDMIFGGIMGLCFLGILLGAIYFIIFGF